MTTRFPVLQGDQIYFSTLHKDDLANYVRWFSNLEFTAYLGRLGFAPTLEDEQAWFERASKHTNDQVTFAIIEREGDRPIGNVSLMEIDQRHGTATLGIAIGEPDARGRGFGTEAVQLMTEYGFYFLNLWNIKLWYVDFNRRGERAYQKAGFREVGRVRQSCVIGGERYDLVLMDLLRDEVDLSRMRRMISLLVE